MKPQCFSSFSKIKPSFDSSHQNSSSLSRILIDSYYNPYLWFPPNKNPVHEEIGRWYSSQHPVREEMVDDRVRRRKSLPDGDYITIAIFASQNRWSPLFAACVLFCDKEEKRDWELVTNVYIQATIFLIWEGKCQWTIGSWSSPME